MRPGWNDIVVNWRDNEYKNRSNKKKKQSAIRIDLDNEAFHKLSAAGIGDQPDPTQRHDWLGFYKSAGNPEAWFDILSPAQYYYLPWGGVINDVVFDGGDQEEDVVRTFLPMFFPWWRRSQHILDREQFRNTQEINHRSLENFCFVGKRGR